MQHFTLTISVKFNAGSYVLQGNKQFNWFITILKEKKNSSKKAINWFNGVITVFYRLNLKILIAAISFISTFFLLIFLECEHSSSSNTEIGCFNLRVAIWHSIQGVPLRLNSAKLYFFVSLINSKAFFFCFVIFMIVGYQNDLNSKTWNLRQASSNKRRPSHEIIFLSFLLFISLSLTMPRKPRKL